jgi:hypothetical protein
MTWTTNPYAALTDVHEALDLQSTSDDTWIQGLLNQAQDAIDAYVGYPFQTDGTVQTPATRVYNGSDTEVLLIDRCTSISQVTEVQYNIIMGSNGSYYQSNSTTVDITADVVLGPPNYTASRLQSGYVLYRKSGYPFILGKQNYTVSGIFGIPLIPPDITRACIRLVVHYYKMRDTNYSDTIAETGSVRQHYTKNMPPDVCEILERYRKRSYYAWGG